MQTDNNINMITTTMKSLKVSNVNAIQLNNHALSLFRLGKISDAERCLNRALLASIMKEKTNRKENLPVEERGSQERSDCQSKLQEDCDESFRDEGEYDDEGMRVYCDPLHIQVSSSSTCEEIVIRKTIFFNLGIAYVWLKQYEEAYAYFSKTLSLHSSHEGIAKAEGAEFNGPSDVAILHNLGYVDFIEGRYTDAFSNYGEALRISLKLKGYYNSDVATCLNCIGIVTMYNFIENDENGERALGFFTEALAIRKGISPGDSQSEGVSVVKNNIARVKVIRGDLEGAMEIFKEIFQIRKSTFGANHVQTAMSIFSIGETYHMLGNTDSAMNMYLKFLKIISSHMTELKNKKLPYTQIHVEIGIILNQIGNLSCERGDLKTALTAYKLGHDIEQVIYHGKDESNIIITMLNIARIHHMESDLPLALEWYERGLLAQRQSISVDRLDLAQTLTKIGVINEHLGHYGRSLTAYKEALGIKKGELGTKNLDVSYLLNFIGIVYTKTESYRESISFYEESLSIHRRLSSDDHKDTVAVLYNLGIAYMETDRLTESLHTFKECLYLEQCQANGAENNDGIISTLKCIGRVYDAQDEPEKAVYYYQKAVNLCLSDCLRADHGDVAQIFGIIGGIFLSMGEIKEAMKSYAKAINANRLAGLDDMCNLSVKREVLTPLLEQNPDDAVAA